MPMTAPERGVKVRMYRHGLGDCFLLAFRGPDDGPRYLLIDCGILLNSPGERSRIETVMRDIRDDTGGHVHVLIATHEHWDHVCGFLHQRELFAKELQVDEIWMAWTEDPADPQAKALAEKHEQAFRAVSSALTRMRGLEAEDAQELTGQVEAVTAFFGGSSRGSLGFGKRTDEAMDLLREKAVVRYREPGDTFTHPELPGARFYVLGPPRSKELFRSDPRRGEAYEVEDPELDDERSLHQAFRVGVDQHWTDTDRELWQLSRPFDEKHELPLEQAKTNPWFQARYYAAAGPDGRDQAWRRIDESWLGSAAELALQLDSDTNNSSLVLAIELGDAGKVLLFPGDAQAGSWRSWETVQFELPGVEKPVTAHQLLARTALYKVGHHGSHNATLRGKGLELMGDDLIALVPVDRDVALGGGRGWNMPFPPLQERLLQKCRGRVIRADADLPEASPQGIQQAEWDAFRAGLNHSATILPTERQSKERPLYVELTLEP